MSIDVSGQVINLSQLQDEFMSASIPIEYGLLIDGRSDQPVESGDLHQPPGAMLFALDADAQKTDLPPEAQAVVDAHVAMRDKTDAELAAEFRAPGTTPARKQDIRDMQSGLLEREQVPM